MRNAHLKLLLANENGTSGLRDILLVKSVMVDSLDRKSVV